MQFDTDPSLDRTVNIKQVRTLTPEGYRVVTVVSLNGFSVPKEGNTPVPTLEAAERLAFEQLQTAVNRAMSFAFLNS